MASLDVRRDLLYVYGWNYYTMRFMGTWPKERKWNEISSYKALIPILLMVSFVCVPQTINLRYIWSDFDLVVENLSMGNISITISLLKTTIFWLNGKSLTRLMVYMSNDWRTTTKKTSREIMLNTAKKARQISIRSTVIVQLVVFTYLAMRLIAMRHSENRYFFRAYFPYDVNVSPNREITFFGQFVAATYAATSYTAVDTFVAMLILHVCGQLSNLKHELRNLHVQNGKEFRIKLRNIVQKHEYLSRFAETIEECFNMMLLIQMLGCTIQLCFQCFQAIMSINEELNDILIFQFIFLFIYIVYVLLQLFLYCYVGEKLFVESTEIGLAAYECEWYNFAPAEARLLIIIMRRAKLPFQITAGRFCTFSLELYSQVLKTAMGYISVLYATIN